MSVGVCVCVCVQGKWTVPLPKVKAVGEDEVFRVIRTGKKRSKLACTFCVCVCVFCLYVSVCMCALCVCVCVEIVLSSSRKGLEAYGDKGHLRGRGFHKKTTQVRAVYSSHGRLG